MLLTLRLAGFVAFGLSFSGCASSSSVTEGVARTHVVPGSLTPDSVTVVPGPEYSAGWLHRVFFGEHYRHLWTAPVRVPILNLGTFGGGLTPTEAGGGFQTKSLKFNGNDGQTYKFRSVDKNPRAVLPLELRETLAADLAQDHISTSHPAGALVVDALAGAVSVPRVHPRLVYLADTDALGTFREQFGGILGVLEVYPDAPEDGRTGFMGATKVQNTLKVFEAMDEDSEDHVDAIAYLIARLLDVFVGDWDRHVKQWRWARFKDEGRTVWKPIPLDRDQAFVRLDGFFPWLASMAVPQFEPFRERFNNLYSLTFSGRYLDRRILAGVDRHTWDSVASVFTAKLTDEVIDAAVKELPPEYYALDGLRLATALKSRRHEFARASSRFYELLAEYVDIHLSDKQEFVEVERLSDCRVRVTAWRRDKDTGKQQPGAPVFHRVFSCADTEEIRIYLHGGSDRVEVSGTTDGSILVRVIGGKGKDELIDTSIVLEPLFGFVPFVRTTRDMTFLYDADEK